MKGSRITRRQRSPYEKLSETPKAFKGLSGLTLDEFDELYETFEPAWMEAEEKRLGRPARRRAIGGGGQYALDLRTQQLLVFFWLRLYLTTETVGYLFGLHKSNVSRNGRRFLPVLRQVSEGEFGWPDSPQRGHGRTIE